MSDSDLPLPRPSASVRPSVVGFADLIAQRKETGDRFNRWMNRNKIGLDSPAEADYGYGSGESPGSRAGRITILYGSQRNMDDMIDALDTVNYSQH
jgi:hypothetical protein